jgi:hypothetical protein
MTKRRIDDPKCGGMRGWIPIPYDAAFIREVKAAFRAQRKIKRPPVGGGLHHHHSTKERPMLIPSITTVSGDTTSNSLSHPETAGSVADWLSSMIRRGQSKPFSEVVELTPELARLLLGLNYENRSVSMAFVEKYGTDFEEGNWALNGEAIIVADTGALNDGQHRCHAVIAANKSAETFIVFGVKRETRKTLGTGKIRRGADLLKMSGATPYNATVARAAAFLLASFRRNVQVHVGRYVTETIVQNEYWSNEDAIETATKLIMNDWTGGRVVGGGPTVHVAAFTILDKANPYLAKDFVRRVVTGEDLKAGDAALVIRNWLILQRGGRNPRKLEAYLRAWNLFRTKKNVTKIVTNGTFPESIES